MYASCTRKGLCTLREPVESNVDVRRVHAGYGVYAVKKRTIKAPNLNPDGRRDAELTCILFLLPWTARYKGV